LIRNYCIAGDERQGRRRRRGTPSEEIASRLYSQARSEFALNEGETIIVESKWDNVFDYSLLDQLGMGANQTSLLGGAFDDEVDLFASFGRAQLSGAGRFTFRREGDAIYFEGSVTYSLPDRYDFNEGADFILFVGGTFHHHSSEEINALQRSHAARPFDLAVPMWSQIVRGKISIVPLGLGRKPAVRGLQWHEPVPLPATDEAR
jgi:hypothetical protein